VKKLESVRFESRPEVKQKIIEYDQVILVTRGTAGGGGEGARAGWPARRTRHMGRRPPMGGEVRGQAAAALTTWGAHISACVATLACVIAWRGCACPWLSGAVAAARGGGCRADDVDPVARPRRVCAEAAALAQAVLRPCGVQGSRTAYVIA